MSKSEKTELIEICPRCGKRAYRETKQTTAGLMISGDIVCYCYRKIYFTKPSKTTYDDQDR